MRYEEKPQSVRPFPGRAGQDPLGPSHQLHGGLAALCLTSCPARTVAGSVGAENKRLGEPQRFSGRQPSPRLPSQSGRTTGGGQGLGGPKHFLPGRRAAAPPGSPAFLCLRPVPHRCAALEDRSTPTPRRDIPGALWQRTGLFSSDHCHRHLLKPLAFPQERGRVQRSRRHCKAGSR